MITEKINSIGRNKCTGCHACATICPTECIEMLCDEEGFWYPQVNEGCIDCGKCIDVCHIFRDLDITRSPAAYACWNSDDNIRMNSSSGGVFHELARIIISQNGVVFGAAFNNDFEVEHRYIETEPDISIFQGSKYVQSRIGNSYKQVEAFLKKGRKVLFSGTPCQIGGLKTFLGKEYKTLLSVDFICHGVPSPLVWRKYLDYQKTKHANAIEDISFRAKDRGWKLFSMKIRFADSSIYIKALSEDYFLRSFMKNLCLRPSCHNCDFKTLNRESDITLADFWGLDRYKPELFDNKGISLVLINSEVAGKLLSEMQENISYQEVDLQQSVQYNPSAIRSVNPHRNRSKFFGDIKNDVSFDRLGRKYLTEKKWAPLYNRVKKRLKSFMK